MVKLWGCNDHSKNGRIHVGVVSGSSTEGGKNKVIMKLPKSYDIQRFVLARHLMYLRHSKVRHGKMECPKEFEMNVAKFRKLGIGTRASGSLGGIIKTIRRKQVLMTPAAAMESRVHALSVEDDIQYKWNIEEMSFKSSVPGMLKELRLKFNAKNKRRSKKRTAAEADEEERKSREDEWQRQNWLKKVLRDMKSERVNEILANYRMTSFNGEAVGFQPTYTIYLESAHYALKTHNWTTIAKSLCGMTDKFRTTQYLRGNWQFPSGLNIFWMLGFLTIINHHKDNISQVEQFASNVHALLGGHPLWIASHLAVWLMQKGYFMAAYRIVNKDYSLDSLPMNSRYQSAFYSKMENPKRDMAIYLTSMIKAVYLYCIWKKESTILEVQESGNYEVENLTDDVLVVQRDTLRRKGEDALGAFEVCYDKYKTIEGDAMCFIQPFIELVVELRSVQRAREILEEIFNINDGNLFVEEFYVEFLEEHFSFSEDDQDLVKFLRRRTERKFNMDEKSQKEASKIGKRQIKEIKKLKNGRISTGHSVFTMKKVPKPGFSW